jgi:hypothetical protein
MKENQNSTLQQDYYELIVSLLKYARQESELTSELVDPEMYSYFNLKPENKPQPVQHTPLAKPVEKKVVVAEPPPLEKRQLEQVQTEKPKVATPKAANTHTEKTPEKKIEQKPAPEKAHKAETLVSTLNPLFTLLPKQPLEKELPPFDDIQQKLQKLAPMLKVGIQPMSDEQAQQKVEAWKKCYQPVAFISFCSPASPETLFIKNVSDAVTSRLKSSKLYHPTPEALLELLFLAQENLLETIIVSFDNQSLAKANDYFLSIITLFEAPGAKESPPMLTIRGKLFATTLFDLNITESIQNNSSEKALLWKTLRDIIKPVNHE